MTGSFEGRASASLCVSVIRSWRLNHCDIQALSDSSLPANGSRVRLGHRPPLRHYQHLTRLQSIRNSAAKDW